MKYRPGSEGSWDSIFTRTVRSSPRILRGVSSYFHTFFLSARHRMLIDRWNRTWGVSATHTRPALIWNSPFRSRRAPNRMLNDNSTYGPLQNLYSPRYRSKFESRPPRRGERGGPPGPPPRSDQGVNAGGPHGYAPARTGPPGYDVSASMSSPSSSASPAAAASTLSNSTGSLLASC